MKYDFLLGKNNIQMVSTCLSKTRVKQCKYVPWLFVNGGIKNYRWTYCKNEYHAKNQLKTTPS